MKNTALNLTNWVMINPQRAFVILSIIVIILTLVVAGVPVGTAWAEDVVSGS